MIFAVSCGQNAQQKKSADAPQQEEVGEIEIDKPYQAAEASELAEELKAMEAYKAILQNDLMFYNTENKKNYTLNEFNYDSSGEMEEPHIVHRYTFISLSGDEVESLVLELSAGGVGAFEVLRYQEGTVYGFYFDYRALLDITYNGTSFGSSGASDGSFSRLSIEKDVCKNERLGYSESQSDGNVLYFIDDKKVTRSTYNEFESDMWRGMGDKEMIWYDYTEDNVASMLRFNERLPD